jgi:Zn-dependent M28 family amino/carboxypeptidase
MKFHARRAPGAAASLLLAASLAACGSGPDIDAAAATILAEDLSRLTRTLSGDEFLGRKPGSAGEQRTLDFLQGEMERLGLEPAGATGDDGAASYLQPVPVARITADPATARLAAVLEREAARRDALDDLVFGEDFVLWTLHEEPAIDVTAPLVFVGYGVEAPEEEWSDYGVDVSGAIVMMLVNDPPVPGKFGDEAMTYYGRWTYKFEEAARQGAAGALLIHATEAAGYGWQVVQASWTGPQFSLARTAGEPPPARIEGWISQPAAVRLFAAAGLDAAAVMAAAASAEFEPVDLGYAVQVHLDNDLDRIDSANVVGRLAGREEEEEETVLWMAHWDHLGADPAIEGDGIYNGALDNATGVAALLEIAEALSSTPQRARRSHLFVATTLEEQGLLGSSYYARNPVVAANRTVAAINIDGLNVWGPTEDVTVVGLGNSDLDARLAAVLAAEGRTISPDPEPEKGYFYRSDHFPMAKIGVPALYIDGGVRYRDQAADYSERVRDQYALLHYHQPSDEFDPAWNFSGAVEDVRALLRVGMGLAASDDWPQWAPGTQFLAAREASLQQR